MDHPPWPHRRSRGHHVHYSNYSLVHGDLEEDAHLATSLIELLIGAAAVLGHNLWPIVPNEVPILFVLALVSFRLRDGNWKRLGLTRPASWRKTILWAMAIATVRLAIGALFPEPAGAPKGSDQIPGHPLNALAALAFVWIFAAFGEEVSYRAYLTTRAADVTKSWWAAALITSILFGLGHFYKGPAGMIDSGIAGLLLAHPAARIGFEL